MNTQQLIDTLTQRVCEALGEEFRDKDSEHTVFTRAVVDTIAWYPIVKLCVGEALRKLLPEGGFTTYIFFDQICEEIATDELAKHLGLTLEELKKVMRITSAVLFSAEDLMQTPVIISKDRQNFSIELNRVIVVRQAH